MGNPSAAHEPTMEEILASIRQIISEDGDRGQTRAAKSFRVPAEEEDAESEAAPQAAAEPAPESLDDDDDFPDFSSAGPAAQEFAPHEAGPHEAGSHQRGGAPVAESEAEDGFAAMAEPEAAAPEEHFEERPTYEEPTYEEPTYEEPIYEEPAGEEPAGEEPAAAEPKPRQAYGAGAGRRADAAGAASAREAGTVAAYRGQSAREEDRLLSPDADDAVAGAFSALAHTILSQNARTLEDLVTDMLRPMLRDWLDENLPTLVERLVKEEIERVSRGRR